MYLLIKTKYRLKKITAKEVWDYVDQNAITEAQALSICGPRPDSEE